MMRLIKLQSIVILVLAFFSAAYAQHRITRSVVVNGAGLTTGDHLIVKGSAGQALAGISGNPAFNTKIGFWYTVDRLVSDLAGPEQFLPEKYELFQNYPNPFNPVTTICFTLPQRSYVLLEVYDLLGRHVSTLVDRQMPAGRHTFRFGSDNLPTGFYMYRIRTDGYMQEKKMLLIK